MTLYLLLCPALNLVFVANHAAEPEQPHMFLMVECAATAPANTASLLTLQSSHQSGKAAYSWFCHRAVRMRSSLESQHALESCSSSSPCQAVHAHSACSASCYRTGPSQAVHAHGPSCEWDTCIGRLWQQDKTGKPHLQTYPSLKQGCVTDDCCGTG